MAIASTKKVFIERLRRHIANGWPGDEFSVSNSEILLYIDAAVASSLVAQMMGMAKITKEMSTPEAYIATTQLSNLKRNENTGEWYAQLPQTPLSLSIGYSLSNIYFTDLELGQSQPVWLLKSKRAAYRNYLPKAGGTLGQVRGNYIYIKANDGASLANMPIFVEMVKTRTTDINEPMNLPDDMIDMVFDKVVQKCLQRMGIPKDVIKDDIGQGATNINKS